jgi:hypothetical protein
VEGLALRTPELGIAQNAVDDIVLVFLGDRREPDDLPVFLVQDVSDQIVLMQALHDHDDGARGLVVEAAQQRIVVPFVDRVAPGFRQGIVRLERIVDDDDIGATAGQDAADRRRHSGSLLGGGEVVDGLSLREPGGKQRLVPGGVHDVAAVACQLVGEVLAVAGADDVFCCIMAKQPCDEGDRRAVRFELAWRQVDDEPFDLAAPHGFQFGGDQLDIGRAEERRLRIEFVERSFDETHKVASEEIPVIVGR